MPVQPAVHAYAAEIDPFAADGVTARVMEGLDPAASPSDAVRLARVEAAKSGSSPSFVASRRTTGPGQDSDVCGEVPALLAARANGALGGADLERLRGHLETCDACRGAEARAERAEAAFTRVAEEWEGQEAFTEGGHSENPDEDLVSAWLVDGGERQSEPDIRASDPQAWIPAPDHPAPAGAADEAPGTDEASAPDEAPGTDEAPAPDETSGAVETPGPDEPARDSRGFPMAVLVGLSVLLILAGVALLATGTFDSEDSKPTARRAPAPPFNPVPVGPPRSRPKAPPARAPTSKPLDLSKATAKDYDPLGDTENPNQAKLAIDGKPSTKWSTEIYSGGTLGKAGVGLYVGLRDRRRLRSLTIDTPSGGWSAAVYGSNGADAPVDLPSPRWKLLARAAPVHSGRAIRLKAARPARVLVWITDLHGKDKVEIGEIAPAG